MCRQPIDVPSWRCRDEGLDASSKVSLGRGRKPGDGIRLNGSSSFGNRILVEWRQKARLDRGCGRAQALPKPKYTHLSTFLATLHPRLIELELRAIDSGLANCDPCG